MKEAIRRLLPIVIAVFVSFGLVGCAGESGANAAEADAGLLQQADEPTSERQGIESREEAGGHEEGEEGGEHDEGAATREGHEEGEGGEHEEGGEGEEGEEGGEYLGREATWDATRRGVRLVLSFNAEQNAFLGTVRNTTEQILCAVRVEVHLSDGPELGPTERTDLAPGATTAIVLATEGAAVESWTAHPEVSACQ